jgi:hypothetical protein
MQSGQILWRKAGRGDPAAFVDGLRYGQILVFCAGRNQHIALGTTRFCDCAVTGIYLMDKREGLAGQHVTSEYGSNRSQIVTVKCGKRVLDSKGLSCSLLHIKLANCGRLRRKNQPVHPKPHFARRKAHGRLAHGSAVGNGAH